MSEWKYLTLNQMGKIARGKSKHRPRNDPRLYGGRYPFIQTADVKAANLYLTSYSQTYNEDGLAQSKLWPEETLCITIAANIADTAILSFPACFPDSIMGFQADNNVCLVRYVKYCFDILQAKCKQISQGAAQDNLSWERLSSIEFPVPAIELQIKICSILSSYDELIENNRKEIKLLEEAAQRLYKEWFIDFKFPGHETTPIDPETNLPEGWRKGILSDIAEFKRGKTITAEKNKKGTIPVVAGGLEPAYYHSKANAKGPVVTISASGANAGFTRLYTTDIWASDCSFLSADASRVFLFVYESVKCIGRNFKHLQRGSAQPHVYPSHINSMEMLIPTVHYQVAFCETVKPFISQISILHRSIEDAKEARDRLLPKLMSGEIEVN